MYVYDVVYCSAVLSSNGFVQRSNAFDFGKVQYALAYEYDVIFNKK